jgi:putative transposase
LIRESHERSRKTYGSPRVHADLLEQDIKVSRKRVIRIMQADGLRGRVRKRFKCTTMSEHDQPIAPNLLGQDFTADRPDQWWVGDTTELLTGHGKLYLAVLLDLYSRMVVGWALSAVNNRYLVLRALDTALQRRCPGRDLGQHTDQGCTYASEDYRKRLEAHGITCSMSRRGNCLDNAVAESFFSTLKSELGERFVSPAQAKAALFDYIEVFYNQQRRHSSLGQKSPAQYERLASQMRLAA